MAQIEIETIIKSNKKICFDLSRNIDFHKVSMEHTNEKAISGKVEGLIGLGEEVTWEGKHFGIIQRFTSKITGFESPDWFCDEMQKGAFKSFIHDHYFEEIDDYTKMKDVINFESPLWIIGKVFNKLILKSYLINLITIRNDEIRKLAESGAWKNFLKEEKYL